MKKLILAVALMAGVAGAAEFYTGVTITATTSATSCTTALADGAQYAVYSDVAARYVACRNTSCVVDSHSAPIPAGRLYDVPLPGEHKYLCFLGQSATATIDVYRVTPRQARE